MLTDSAVARGMYPASLCGMPHEQFDRLERLRVHMGLTKPGLATMLRVAESTMASWMETGIPHHQFARWRDISADNITWVSRGTNPPSWFVAQVMMIEGVGIRWTDVSPIIIRSTWLDHLRAALFASLFRNDTGIPLPADMPIPRWLFFGDPFTHLFDRMTVEQLMAMGKHMRCWPTSSTLADRLIYSFNSVKPINPTPYPLSAQTSDDTRTWQTWADDVNKASRRARATRRDRFRYEPIQDTMRNLLQKPFLGEPLLGGRARLNILCKSIAGAYAAELLGPRISMVRQVVENALAGELKGRALTISEFKDLIMRRTGVVVARTRPPAIPSNGYISEDTLHKLLKRIQNAHVVPLNMVGRHWIS